MFLKCSYRSPILEGMSLDHADLAVPAPTDLLPDRPRKGRGAVSNRVGRYEPETREAVDDGWATGDEDEDLPPLRTSVTIDSGDRRGSQRFDVPNRESPIYHD